MKRLKAIERNGLFLLAGILLAKLSMIIAILLAASLIIPAFMVIDEKEYENKKMTDSPASKSQS